MKILLSALLVVGAVLSAHSQEANSNDWAPVKFMIGSWQGTAKGEPGEGTVARSYKLALKNQFIQEYNVSTYLPHEKNQKGEVHQHLGFVSFDKKRKALMMRQFHQEGFVIVYAFNAAASKPNVLVFESESFENFDNTWKSRETYEVISNDEFIETFELAEPGKSFEVYSKTHFKRSK